MKRIFTIISICFPLLVLSQARLVLNNNGYIVIDNGAFLVIDNSATNAITTAGTGGYIVSEAETDRVKWNIGTTVGAYTVPFGANVGGWQKIPVTITKSSGGTGAGNITFSTYHGPTWDNSTYPPSDVTHMTNLPGLVNNSAYVIDRFWILDPLGYTTKPNLSSIVFTYIDAEHSVASNTITESNLQAQRFNNTSNLWADMLPIGTVNTGANTVNTGAVANSNYFRSWTLVDRTSPLPIELLSFKSVCEENRVKLIWTTASEIINNFFTIEKSQNGIDFYTIGYVNGAGTTNLQQTYHFIDDEINTTTVYYRLKQTDYNGAYEYFEPLAVNKCQDNNDDELISVFENNGINLLFKSNTENIVSVKLLDISGKLIYETVENVSEGINTISFQSKPAQGVYLITLTTDKKQFSKKLFVK